MAPRASAPQHCVEQLYRDHQPWLLRWFRRRLVDREHAADLSQDAFLRLLGKAELPVEQRSRAFLALVAKGLLVDHWRRAALERSYLEYLAHQPEAEHPSPERQMQALQQLREVDRLLDGLPAKARRAFLLNRLVGLTQAQIAQQLGVSPARVQQYLAKATLHCYEARHGALDD